jgi:hybrid cluster-associated redox disulfide protein
MGRYSADMLIQDVLMSHPGVPAIFERYGLACGSCFAADMETLQSVAHMHDVPLDSLVAELDALSDQSEKEGR